MIRRLIQFGTKFNDILKFPQDRFDDDWEDTWSDEVQINSTELQFADGSFRNLGFDQSRKVTKNITKRFTVDLSLYDDSTKSKYIDHIHRVLRGGVKKLIAEREDGTLMYTYAEAVNMGYTRNGNGEVRRLAYTIDFVAHIPYWFTFREGQVGYWFASSIEDYFNYCDNYLDVKFDYVTERYNIADCSECLELIIEDGSFGACFSCVQQGGVTDNQILKQFGVLSIPTASTLCTYDGVVDVTFFNSWTNPTITVGNLVITYSGSILDGFYLHLSTQNYNGNVSSLVVDNTVSGFDSSNLTITGSLINGNNSISYSGNNINGLITYNSINKYHN